MTAPWQISKVRIDDRFCDKQGNQLRYGFWIRD